jgi:hypothetical protein
MIADILNSQSTAVWIGIAISLGLGLINLLWGPALLKHGEKVKLRSNVFCIELFKYDNKPLPFLIVTCNFRLVRVKGSQDIYFDHAYIYLHPILWEDLKQSFDLHYNFIYINKNWLQYNSPEASAQHKKGELRMNEPYDISIQREFPIKQDIWDQYKDIPNGINSITDKINLLERKHKIVWEDGKGKKRSYRIPSKWWDRVIPERIWWRIS